MRHKTARDVVENIRCTSEAQNASGNDQRTMAMSDDVKLLTTISDVAETVARRRLVLESQLSLASLRGR